MTQNISIEALPRLNALIRQISERLIRRWFGISPGQFKAEGDNPGTQASRDNVAA